MARARVAFPHAVENWKRYCLDAADASGWRETCGSAERIYAGSPERYRGHDGDIEVPVDRANGERMERMVRMLPEAERIAWHVKQGFRERPKGVSQEWIEEHYEKARVRLVLWWSAWAQ